MGSGEKGGYILEYIVCGNLLKVSAVDPETGKEAVVWGRRNAKWPLVQLAIGKLERLLKSS
ncbi:MAG: hypothetical protein JSS50_02895 [Proteobacteria bacterium]|nr:hypothetical protein [Pseudomonadota bacterium]